MVHFGRTVKFKGLYFSHQPTPGNWEKNENKDTFEIELYYFLQGCFLEPQLLEKPLVLAWLVSENKYKTVLKNK